MSIFSDLRGLVYLRKISRHLDEIAQHLHTIARLQVEADERRIQEGYRPPPRKMEVGMFSQVEASRNWRKMMVDSGQRTYEELNEEYGELPDK